MHSNNPARKQSKANIPKESSFKRSQAAHQSISKKKQEILPQIHSPFLKKTVYNLFSDISQSNTFKLIPSHHSESYTPLLSQQQKASMKGSKIFNQVDFASEAAPNEASRICKSFSESKRQKEEISAEKWLAIRESLGKASKILTENSVKGKGGERRCSYVVKQKMAQSLFSEEKSEVRLVRDYFSSREKGIGQSMNIKNYAKFFPNIIEIQN